MADPSNNEPETPEQLRDRAREDVADAQKKLHDFRADCEAAVGTQVDRTFTYLQNVLNDKSKPADWLRDGVALWIRSYGTGKDLYNAAYKLWGPPPAEEE